MLRFFKFWLKIGLYIAIPVGLLVGAFYIGKHYQYLYTPEPVVESSFVERIIPTEIPTLAPTTKPKVITNNDPLVDCNFTYIGTMKLKSSVCSKSTECQINGKWIYYDSVDKCRVDQRTANNATNTSQQTNLVTCVVYYPINNKTYTYQLTPEACTYYQEKAKLITSPSSIPTTAITPYVAPTTDPATAEQQRLADIQSCKDSAKRKHDNESTTLRNIYRAAGSLSSSDYGKAVQKLQDDYIYWLYLCENAY